MTPHGSLGRRCAGSRPRRAAGSARKTIPHGMNRSGYAPNHSSVNQSFHARTQAAPSVGVGAGREHRATEAADRGGEVERRPDAGLVHVGHPRVGVPTAAAHLVEPHGLHRRVVLAATDHRVEPDLRVRVAVEHPDLVALRGGAHVRRPIGQRRGHPTLEEVPRLDHVIVDRDHGPVGRDGAGRAGSVGAGSVELVMAESSPGRQLAVAAVALVGRRDPRRVRLDPTADASPTPGVMGRRSRGRR